MNKIRTSVAGLGLCAPCFLFTLSMAPGLDTVSSGPVHGRVTYNGQPLTGCFIVFATMPGTPGEWGSASVGRGGYYTIDSKWQRRNQEGSRYRICIIPNAKPLVSQLPSRSEDAGVEAVPTTLMSEKPRVSNPVGVEHQFPERFSDLRTSGLTVSLGHESARVDIDLKD